jgi:glucose/arabinose dehydrogenase
MGEILAACGSPESATGDLVNWQVGGAGGTPATAGTAGSGSVTMPNTSTTFDCRPAEGAAGNLTLTTVATGLALPTFVTAPPGDDTRLFIVERAGRILLSKNGVRSLFLDIGAKVTWEQMSERGMFAMAFHPDYANNGRFFVAYTSAPGGNITVEEYKRNASNPDTADASPVGAKYIDQPPTSATHKWHNGGGLAFNPIDKLLYLAIGESGDNANAQNKSRPLGKLLRIDVSTNPFTVPSGNLAGAAAAVYDYGLRNPWRFSFDGCTGDRYIGDVGGMRTEEVDVASMGEGPVNWGWPIMEGAECANNNCNQSGLKLPAVSYPHTQGLCASVIGGYVYRGSKIPWLRGAYVYGDLCTGKTSSFRWKDNVVSDHHELAITPTGQLVSFGQDGRGEIYLVHMQVGRVSRLDPQ